LTVVPVPSPLQLVKVESVAGVAVKVMVLFIEQSLWQVVPRLSLAFGLLDYRDNLSNFQNGY
jgi:hypothetical protein